VGHPDVNGTGRLGGIVSLIGLITIVSGAVQMVAPALVLRAVGGEPSPSTDQFFGTVGMFMVLFGGLTVHGVRAQSTPALLWAGLQKVGAVAAVAVGVTRALLSPVALGVASFDLLSAVLILACWRIVAAAQD
jgi:hypothetical protein